MRCLAVLPVVFGHAGLPGFAGAWFILAPSAYENMARSIVAAVVFVSNIWFWKQTGDYVGMDAHLQPMLHTWSLAVEEQFYLDFPLLLWLLVIIAAITLGWLSWRFVERPFRTPSAQGGAGNGVVRALGLQEPGAMRQLRR